MKRHLLRLTRVLPLTLCAIAGAVQPAAGDQGRAKHQALLEENRFPSASTCRTCHPEHYREWSVSPHAYAQMSVVFQTMNAAIVSLTNGTNGDFCIRCHTPVGMNLGEPTILENEKRHPTSREGVTCITCHRVNGDYGRITGRIPIVEGELCDTVYGPSGNAQGINEEVLRVIADPKIRVATCGKRGRTIHERSEQRVFLTESGFCGSCHDVRLVNGFRLEDAFSEYKTSPAALEGISCQDCHMASEPGKRSPYLQGPAAVVGGVETRVRKRTNHTFPGPDYSIIHPGIFPHNSKAAKMASISAWLKFDYLGGWGDRESNFELGGAKGIKLPREWRSAGKRRRARSIIRQNCELLDQVAAARLRILQEGFRLDEIVIDQADAGGVNFKVKVMNGTDGHGVPTGFDAERLVFLRVTVLDRKGKVLFRSGDYDPNGDVRDLHSLYVHNHELPLDKYLFSLQTRFLTRNLRGTEREQVLPINHSLDPLPFLRPEARPTSIYGRPRGARKHKQVILPGMHRWARYKLDGAQLSGAGPYTAKVELVAQMVPVNLIHEISFMGFEYGMSPKEVAQAVVAGADVLWAWEGMLTGGTVSAAEITQTQSEGAVQCRYNPQG